MRIVGGWPAGYRQPSYLGHHDFAALSGISLSIALAAIALPRWRIDRRLAIVAGLAGALGLFVSGSSAGAIGLAAGAVVAAWVARRSPRRVLAIAGITVAVSGGVVLVRGGDVESLLHLVGIGKRRQGVYVENYVQRTMLAYLGWRIFLDHPVGGVGWQASNDPFAYEPYLPTLHRRFPNTPEAAFPAPSHPIDLQSAYVQVLADLGAVGILVFLAALLTPLLLALRRLLRGPPEPLYLLAGSWLLVTMAILSAIGAVAGIPVDAMLWIAVGLCAAPLALAAGPLRPGSDPS